MKLQQNFISFATWVIEEEIFVLNSRQPMHGHSKLQQLWLKGRK
jgi:hypothetical protein